MPDFFRGKKWDLVGKRNLWFAISGVTILLGLVFWFLHGLNYGIDFTGGGLLTYKLSRAIPAGQQGAAIAQARRQLAGEGIPDARIQIAGTATVKDQILIRTQVKPKLGEDAKQILDRQKDRVTAGLEKQFPGVQSVGAEMVTGVVSKELKTKATVALILGSILILIFISFRYDYKFAVAAIMALAHDMLVLVGWFAIFHKEVNTPFVAALLTVVGYSVHDTIIIFDRIRENVKLRKAPTFAEITNRSLLETLARSVNTVVTVEFVLLALLFLGGVSMRGFAEALLVGVTTGAYSSIFNASQIVVVWKRREEQKQAAKRAPRAAAAPTPPRSRPTPIRQPAAAGPSLSASSSEATASPADPEEDGTEESGVPRSQRKKLKAKKRKRRF